jgi:hypothetical protein
MMGQGGLEDGRSLRLSDEVQGGTAINSIDFRVKRVVLLGIRVCILKKRGIAIIEERIVLGTDIGIDCVVAAIWEHIHAFDD